MFAITQALRDRFTAKIDKGENPGDCWEWLGASRGVGYGAIKIEGKVYDAHRVAYILAHNEPIPEGMLVCHTCGNRSCVRPSCLKLGTHSDNAKDMVAHGTVPFRKRYRETPLTDEQIATIRDEFSRGVSRKALCRKYGVPYTSMHRLLKPVRVLT